MAGQAQKWRFCTIFERSEVLEAAFGGGAQDMIVALAFQDSEPNYPKTMGGRSGGKHWRKQLRYKVQQNVVSQHYRILDQDDRRLFSSFELQSIKKHLDSIK